MALVNMSPASSPGVAILTKHDEFLYRKIEKAISLLPRRADVFLVSSIPISDELKLAFSELGIKHIAVWPVSNKSDWPATSPSGRPGTALLLWSSQIVGLNAVRFLLWCRVSKVLLFSRRWQIPRNVHVIQFAASEIWRSLSGRFSGWSFLKGYERGRRWLESRAGKRIRRLKLSDFKTRSAGDDPVLYATGSLGAGGSERQLVLTAKGVKRLLARDVHIVTRSDLVGDLAFFAEAALEKDVVLHDGRSCCDDDDDLVPPELQRLNEVFPGNTAFADAIWYYAERIKRVRPAVVHCWLDETNVVAGIAAVMCGVPRVVLGGRSLSPVNFGFYQPYFRVAYQELLALPQVKLLNNSFAGRRDYARWLGLPENSIEVVPNGLEIAATETGGLRPEAGSDSGAALTGGPVIGMIGRIAEEKRPFLWLDIARLVLDRRPDARFVWIGSGPMREVMLARAKDIGIGDRLSVPGLSNDVTSAFRSMTLFLMTSRVEGLPNASIEAQHFGIPVVIAAVGGAPETIAEGITGVSVTGDEPDKFADAVMRFLENPDLAKMARQAAPAFVADTFSVDRMLQRSIEIYKLDRV